jgi:hypoxanthine phosphoribosyltransferase
MKEPKPYLEGIQLKLDTTFVTQLEDLLIDYLWVEHLPDGAEEAKIAVVALAHDALPVAHYITRNMELPIYSVNNAMEFVALLKTFKGRYKKVIVVDDIYDTGTTFDNYTEASIGCDQPTVNWIFLVAKQPVPQNTFAACTIETTAYIVFPWESELHGQTTNTSGS